VTSDTRVIVQSVVCVSVWWGVQDKLRMCGAKAERHVFLFKRALLVAKKRDDVTMSVKAFIEVNCLRKL